MTAPTPTPPSVIPLHPECQNTMRFDHWLAELNAEAGRRGYVEAETFAEGTGTECWRTMYEDGLTPVEALDEDESNG